MTHACQSVSLESLTLVWFLLEASVYTNYRVCAVSFPCGFKVEQTHRFLSLGYTCRHFIVLPENKRWVFDSLKISLQFFPLRADVGQRLLFRGRLIIAGHQHYFHTHTSKPIFPFRLSTWEEKTLVYDTKDVWEASP